MPVSNELDVRNVVKDILVAIFTKLTQYLMITFLVFSVLWHLKDNLNDC